MSVRSPGADPIAASRRAERLLISATFVTFLGNNIQLIASSLLVYRSAGSALSVGWVFILVAVPQVVLSALFGRLADRIDRRKLCAATDVCSGTVALGLPVAIALGLSASAAAYVVSFLLAVLAAIFMPTSNALVRERVLPARLGTVSANYEIAYQGGALISGVAGGFVAQFVGLTPLFYFNAATFFVSAACMLATGRRPDILPDATGPAAESAPEAVAVVPARRAVVRLGFLFSLGTVIVTVANTMLLVAVVHRFRQGAGVLGVADALAGVGMLSAIFLYKRIKDRIDYRLLILVGYVGCAALAFVQPIALWTLLVGIFLGGAGYAFGRVPTRAELMREIENERAGRVFGAANAFGLAASVLLTVLVATVIDRAGVVEGYVTFGVLAGVPALIVALSLFRTGAPPPGARARGTKVSAARDDAPAPA
jgi:MFS family permease